MGLPIVHQLQNIQSSVLDLMTRLKNLQTLEKMAIRTEGDYVINGTPTSYYIHSVFKSIRLD